MKNRKGVWIFSAGGFWFVGIGRGYYNCPLDKATAVRQARRLAAKFRFGSQKTQAIKVLGDDGELIEQIV